MLKAEERTGTKILLEAMSQDKIHLARFVLDALDGGIVDSKTEGAQTPLISSIFLPDDKVRCKFVELLLQRGASVNYQDPDGRTALSYACEKGHLDAVKILVQNSADPEIVDVWGNSALMYAAVGGHSHIVDFLVRAFKRLGLQIDRQNKVGNSAVHVAKFLGHAECFFALTNKRGHEAEGCRDVNYRVQKKVGHLVSKLEALQTCTPVDKMTVGGYSWKTGHRMKQSHLPRMESIEELDRQNGHSSVHPQKLLFHTPKPPLRTCDQLPLSKPITSTDRAVTTTTTTTDDQLPLLTSCSASKNSVFFSPRPTRNCVKRSASSALNILLTPMAANKSDNEMRTEKPKAVDVNSGRFHENYQKRFSLPNAIHSPAPPERTVVPLRKSRAVRRCTASPSVVELLHFTNPPAITSSPTLSVLSNKLLRRFTSPEFKKDVKEMEHDAELTSMRIPRSETFPQDIKHPLVGSKPSIDSISSVKCEFDFHSRITNC